MDLPSWQISAMEHVPWQIFYHEMVEVKLLRITWFPYTYFDYRNFRFIQVIRNSHFQ